MIDWPRLVNFSGLVEQLLLHVSRYKITQETGHDKATVNGWASGGQPKDPKDVGRLIRFALEAGVDISPFQTHAPIYDFAPMQSYEKTIAKGPPDLSWLVPTPPPVADSVSVAGLESDCPVGIASSPLTGDDRWTGLMLDLHYGLSTFKTRRIRPKESWRPPQIAYPTEIPDLSSYDISQPPEVLVTYSLSEVVQPGPIPDLVNSLGIPTEPRPWPEVYEKIKAHPRGHLVGISVMGDGEANGSVVSDVDEAIRTAKELRPPFIELNVSCPNLETSVGDVYDDPALLKVVCQQVQQTLRGTGIALAIKLPWLTQRKLRTLLVECGPLVDIVVLRNTIKVRPVALDRNGQRYQAFPERKYGGLSGPSTFDVTLRSLGQLVAIKEELKQDFGIIAVGGVTSSSQVVDLLNAGASSVQACTTPIFDPLLALKTLVHLSKVSRELDKPKVDGLIPKIPRVRDEIEAYRNLHRAVEQIKIRTGRGLPYDAVVSQWNAWIQTRSNFRVGQARRLGAPRSIADWVRELTSRDKSQNTV